MRRVNVIGCSGSGKSTLARTLAERLDLKFIELDAFQHQANWRQAEREEFLGYVSAAVEADGWVIDGNYSIIRPAVWPKVDTIIWLDYPLPLCLWRMWKRTFRRWAHREVLWNGNREYLWKHFFTKKSLLLWVLQSHGKKRKEFDRLFSSGELVDKQLFRIRSPRDANRFFLESTTKL
jgi:adenylate kinase family enzyme